MTKPSTSSRVAKAANTALAPNFTPGQHDVVCSRGRKAYSLVGNQSFRQIIDENLKVYTQAQTRAEKSMVILAIVDIVRHRSPHGGFIRFCKKTKRYIEIGDKLAREKVGHAFREAISSSTKVAGTWKSSCQTDAGIPSVVKRSEVAMSMASSSSSSSTTDEKNEKQFCDKPLPIGSFRQRMSLLATFAAEFNFDQLEEASPCSRTEMDTAKMRLLTAEAEFGDDDLSIMEHLLEDWDLLGSVLEGQTNPTI